MREDEFDRCVTVFKLRDARERIRAREGRLEGRKAFGDTPGERIGRMEAMKRIETFRSETDLNVQGIQ
jgi:hypothetical protein